MENGPVKILSFPINKWGDFPQKMVMFQIFPRKSHLFYGKSIFLRIVFQRVPSGNLTQLWKITIFNGKNHYFYGHFPQLCQISRGYSNHIQRLSINFPQINHILTYINHGNGESHFKQSPHPPLASGEGTHVAPHVARWPLTLASTGAQPAGGARCQQFRAEISMATDPIYRNNLMDWQSIVNRNYIQYIHFLNR